MKKISIFGKSVPLAAILISILLIGSASAALLTSYGTITQTPDISQAILVDGGTGSVEEVVSGPAGSVYLGDPHDVEDVAQKSARVQFETLSVPEGINVSYQFTMITTDGLNPGDEVDALMIPITPVEWDSWGDVSCKYNISSALVNDRSPWLAIKLDKDGDGVKDVLAVTGQETGKATGVWIDVTWDKSDIGWAWDYEAQTAIPVASFEDTWEVISVAIDVGYDGDAGNNPGAQTVDLKEVTINDEMVLKSGFVAMLAGTDAGPGALQARVLNFNIIFDFDLAFEPGTAGIITTSIIPAGEGDVTYVPGQY